MKDNLTQCPRCDEELVVTEYTCQRCGTKITGTFHNHPLGQLTVEQWELLKIFIATYGNIQRVASIAGVSRPTARARIRQLALALGITPEESQSETTSEILGKLERGEISIDKALKKLKGGEK